jgi:hypothetical protein
VVPIYAIEHRLWLGVGIEHATVMTFRTMLLNTGVRSNLQNASQHNSARAAMLLFYLLWPTIDAWQVYLDWKSANLFDPSRRAAPHSHDDGVEYVTEHGIIADIITSCNLRCVYDAVQRTYKRRPHITERSACEL